MESKYFGNVKRTWGIFYIKDDSSLFVDNEPTLFRTKNLADIEYRNLDGYTKSLTYIKSVDETEKEEKLRRELDKAKTEKEKALQNIYLDYNKRTKYLRKFYK